MAMRSAYWSLIFYVTSIGFDLSLQAVVKSSSARDETLGGLDVFLPPMNLRNGERRIAKRDLNSDPRNLALAGSIASSSDFYSCGYEGGCHYPPENVIDGLGEFETGYANSFCSLEALPYVTIDLGASYSINKIVIWSRPGSSFFARQMRDLEFHVADTIDQLDNTTALFAERPGDPPARTEVFTREEPLTGRYVQVQMQKGFDNIFFCFLELEVFEASASPDTDCDAVDCGDDGHCDTGTPNDGSYMCQCGCNKAGDLCQESLMTDIVDAAASVDADCDTAVITYTRHQNYNYSGSYIVSNLDSRPTYTIQYKTKLEYVNDQGVWLTQEYQEDLDWETNTDIPATVTLTGLITNRDYVAFIQSTFPDMRSNCFFSSPVELCERIEFTTCEETVSNIVSETQQAQETCRSSSPRHAFRVGCSCWRCVVNTFARQQDCPWQPAECL